MKFFKYLIVGMVFGITLTKAEIISWYRIYEMFRFQSFHMYGVIGSAVVFGFIIVSIIKKYKLKSMKGEEITFPKKDSRILKYLFGGIIFGLGWALTGACPGPLFVLLGNGVSVIIIVIASAVLGTYVYGRIKKFLPQ